jgi:hypothetical protein
MPAFIFSLAGTLQRRARLRVPFVCFLYLGKQIKEGGWRVATRRFWFLIFKTLEKHLGTAPEQINKSTNQQIK